MDQKQIQQVVQDVLAEFLRGTEGLAAPVQAGPVVPAESSSHAARPSRSPVSQTSAAPKGRTLAEENIARWLGHAPTRKNAAHIHKLPPFKPLGKIPGEENRHYTENSKSLIPNPRKPEKIDKVLETTPARIGVWRTGTRYLTKVALKLRADHAVAKDAVYAELPKNFAESHGWIPLETKAKTKEEFLLRPDLGRQLDENSLKIVQEKAIKNPDIQITVADGLSAWAAERYAAPMVAELVKLCKEKGYTVGTVFCVRYSRIAIQDVIGETVGAKISIILLGERPGLGSGDSLSNYMVFGPHVGIVNAKKSMISNIHPLGHKPEDAARLTVQMFQKMFEQQCSGVELKV